MTRVGAWVRGVGVGALALYFFDPNVGRRRRALVRDRAAHLARVVRDEAERELRHTGNRLRGVVAAMRRLTRGAGDEVPDGRIARAVRARLARLEHPGAIVFEVRDGCVDLRGAVLARDAERARRTVRHVRGVRAVVDQLEVHAMPDVPALQGRGRSQGLAPDDPTARLALGLVGAAAVLPLLRHVPVLGAARLLVLAALGSAVYGVERARLRPMAGAPPRSNVPAPLLPDLATGI